MSKRDLPCGMEIEIAYPIPGDDFYLVSGDSIAVMRNGKVTKLRGAQKERVKRWVIKRAAKPKETGQ